MASGTIADTVGKSGSRRPRRANRSGLVGRWITLAIVLGIAGYATAHVLAGDPGQPTAISRAGPAAHSLAVTPPSTTEVGPSAPPGQPVPILMYHVIEAPPPGAPYPELYLPADAFANQMRYLAAHHFHAVTLQAVWAYWENGATLPVHPIVLSFDDGYRSQFTNAARTLRRYHWPGVLNLIVSHLHAGTYGLGPHMVQAMIAAGWEIDSHTSTHPDLTTLPASTMVREVEQSRRILRRLFNVPVNYFCYPAGRYNASVIATVRSAGYIAATTTNYGVAHPSQGRFTLDRIRVDGTDTATTLGQKLTALHLLG